MKVSDVAKQIEAQWVGPDVNFDQVSTDSRTIASGALFVALVGENFDGHDYLTIAFDQNAIAAMICQSYAENNSLDSSKTYLIVEDTRLGLGKLAEAWTNQFQVMKVAITGSCGKTTVKEMVASILSLQGETLATQGNFNNDIGVPLTLLRIKDSHQYAVIEMGANHMGEIKYTAQLAHPNIALVNNVGPAHLEGFGSVDNIAQAKAEIYSGLVPNGKAIVNLDDDFAGYFLQQTSAYRQVTYSLRNQDADVHLLNLELLPSGKQRCRISVFDEPLTTELFLLGRHNVANALAATALAWAAGSELRHIEQGLASVKPYPGRMCPVHDIDEFLVIDDSYNANPSSVCTAIDILCDMKGDRCLVLGAMAELGETSRQLHLNVGKYAAEKAIPVVIAMGDGAQAYGEGYLEYAPAGGQFYFASSYQEIAERLMTQHAGATVLVKGSRSAAMEKVIHCLKECLNKESC